MNREELEKMFDDNFYYDFNNGDIRIDLKKYIFDTIIPEVIKEILPENLKEDYDEYNNGYNDGLKEIKQTAKEQFNINL